jgi:N-acetyl-anhydromuramyl-L-alanine amidase AmpD
MGKLKYLVIHCTDTPPKMEVTPKMIRDWHMSPPPRGRGWDRVGYSDMIQRDGDLINLTPYDDDDNITSDEMTWGAVGYNSVGRHIVLVGGRGPLKDFADHFTEEQGEALLTYLKDTILKHPDIIIIGHNQVSIKTCPGFVVYNWLSSHDMGVYGKAAVRINKKKQSQP